MLNRRKDQKIQLYKSATKEVEGITKVVRFRKFIYTEDLFEKGGVWANARAMSLTEISNAGLDYDKLTVKFTVNRNPKITTDLKVIFRGEIYDIKSIDELDFRNVDSSFTAIKTSDPTKYTAKDEFDE
jgi:putative phage head-tail adaptor|nr:MAG TPA: head tail joining protein [Caudoviricetes sp.]